VSVPKEQPSVSDEVLEHMLASAKGHKRDLAIITVFTDAGCRRGELAGVEWGDVDIPSGVIHFQVSNAKARSVPLTDRALVALGGGCVTGRRRPARAPGCGSPATLTA
jgi:integrase